MNTIPYLFMINQSRSFLGACETQNKILKCNPRQLNHKLLISELKHKLLISELKFVASSALRPFPWRGFCTMDKLALSEMTKVFNQVIFQHKNKN